MTARNNMGYKFNTKWWCMSMHVHILIYNMRSGLEFTEVLNVVIVLGRLTTWGWSSNGELFNGRRGGARNSTVAVLSVEDATRRRLCHRRQRLHDDAPCIRSWNFDAWRGICMVDVGHGCWSKNSVRLKKQLGKVWKILSAGWIPCNMHRRS